MNDVIYERGDIVFVNNPLQEPHGHITCGNHPAVIIQNDVGNFHSENLIVAYLTTQLKKLEMPTHVVIQHYDGLRPSMLMAEQLATIDKADVLQYITHLRSEDMLRLDKALISSLGLEVRNGS